MPSTGEGADSQPLHPLAGEISPFNPHARRGPTGIWNEVTLPVLDWEVPEARVVVPISLLDELGVPVPHILRWDSEKYAAVCREHARDLPIIVDLSRYLDTWVYWGIEANSSDRRIRVLFEDTGR